MTAGPGPARARSCFDRLGTGEAVLTVREVAERLRVSTATVYALCRRGELVHFRVSHAIRVPEAALAEHLAPPTREDPGA